MNATTHVKFIFWGWYNETFESYFRKKTASIKLGESWKNDVFQPPILTVWLLKILGKKAARLGKSNDSEQITKMQGRKRT